MLNLKNIITDNTNFITIDSITKDLNGIILVFVEDQVVGIIEYDGYVWMFRKSTKGYEFNDVNLDSLIDTLREKYKCSFNFKFLQFSPLNEFNRY